jgi:hypothetical protein
MRFARIFDSFFPDQLPVEIDSFGPQPKAQAGSGLDNPFACASGCGLNEYMRHSSPVAV